MASELNPAKNKNEKLTLKYLIKNKRFQVLVFASLLTLVLWIIISLIGTRNCSNVLYRGCGVGNIKVCTLDYLYGIFGAPSIIVIPVFLLTSISFSGSIISYFYLKLNRKFKKLLFAAGLISSILLSGYITWYMNNLFSKTITCYETKIVEKEDNSETSTQSSSENGSNTEPEQASSEDECINDEDGVDCVHNDEDYCEPASDGKKLCTHKNLFLSMEIPSDWEFDVLTDDVEDGKFYSGSILITAEDLEITVSNELQAYGCLPTVSDCKEEEYISTDILNLNRCTSSESTFLGGGFNNNYSGNNPALNNFGGIIIEHKSSQTKEFTPTERDMIIDFIDSLDLLERTEKYTVCDTIVDDVELLLEDEIIAGSNKEVRISGNIKGSRCFEGDCPIYLINQDSEIVFSSFIWVEDWTSEEKVKFSGTLEVSGINQSGEYTLVIPFDNPKGEACTEYREDIFVR